MKKLLLAAAFALVAGSAAAAPRNIVVFVADGLRYGSVTAENTPNLWRLKNAGVDFTNSHSLYPTLTTVNASAIATGHYIGDTGDFANSLWVGTKPATGPSIAGMENDQMLAEMNQTFGGNYLNEQTLIARARAAGYSTAVIGKLGPTRIQDSTAAPDGSQTLILDDNSGHPKGFALPGWFQGAMAGAFLPAEAPGMQVPNIPQEVWLMKAATRIVLPHFREEAKPFAMVFWSRDPDMSQHNTKDSIGETSPGINGPSGLAGVRDADTMLGLLLQALKDQGLDRNTDIFVTADHGFLTISHDSATSPSAKAGQIGSGFLLADLGAALELPKINNAALGTDPQAPTIVVAANGGSDLLYLQGGEAKALAARIVTFLTTQDYVASIFVNDRLGKIAGTLPMSALNLIGAARTPVPDIYVGFRTYAGACSNPLQCEIGVHDNGRATGQGNHGSLSRGETRNFMAAIGPDFKARFKDPAPVSNADITPTLAHILGLGITPVGTLSGRVASEALKGGKPVAYKAGVLRSDPAASGFETVLDYQEADGRHYFDAAGMPGRVVGLTAK